MLTREIMGLLALGILWVNALLIAADIAQRAIGLYAKRRALAKAVAGRVVRGDGPSHAFAARVVDQVGRAGADASSILFHDRSAKSEVFGGEVELTGGGRHAFPSSADAEVWLDGGALGDAGACASRAAFDEAYAQARKARGFARTVTASIGVGAEVHVWSHEGRILVATTDPRPLLAGRATLGLAFSAIELAAAAACTLIALRPPVFGAVSTVGGVLGLGFFLGVQPLAKVVRDRMLVPDRAPLGGAWRSSDLLG